MVKVKFVDGSEVEYPTATHRMVVGDKMIISEKAGEEAIATVVAELFVPEISEIEADASSHMVLG
jgi:hypothetical protein